VSVVTNVICVSLDGPERYGKLNEWLRAMQNGQELADVSEYVGGHKAFEADLWAAAFNYLDVEDFIAEWRRVFSDCEFEPDAQLFLKRQEDDKFTVYGVKP